MPGSRKQKQLSEEEIEKMVVIYSQFKRERAPDAVAGFCAVATLDKIQEFNYALTPGRYVGASDEIDQDEPFEERFPKLADELRKALVTSSELEKSIRKSFELLGYDLAR